MTRTNLLIYVQLFLGMVIFGSGTPISKIITDAFPTFVASGLRMLVAFVILFPFAYPQFKRLRDLPRKDWLALGGITLLPNLASSTIICRGLSP